LRLHFLGLQLGLFCGEASQEGEDV